MHRSNSIDVFPSPMGRGAAAARSVCFAAALLLGLLAAAAPAQATRSRGGGVLHIGVSNSGGRVWDVPAGSGSTRHLFVSTGSPTVLGYSCANPLDCPTGRRHRGGWLWWLSEIDGIPPEISAPDDILVEQQNLDGTPLSFDDARLKPLVNDNRDPNPDVLVQVPGLIELTPLEQLSGGRLLEEVGTVTFPLGRTQVIYVAVDENGNRSLPDRTWVTVVDTSPPTLEVVEELVVEAEGPDGAAVALPEPLFPPQDNCDAAPELVLDNLPPDGVFPLYDENGQPGAEWTVVYRATDASGNSVERELVIKVVDTTPPTILLAEDDVTLEQDRRCGATLGVIPGAVVSDAATLQEDLIVELTHRGEIVGVDTCFPLGPSAVTYTVSDLAGNEASAVLSLLVEDTTKPAVREVSYPDRIYHATPREYVVAVRDICDASPDVLVVQVDRPMVRDEREPDFYSARYVTEGVYNVSWTATDDSGNRTITQNRRFGIDRRLPEITYEGISRADVDPLDPMTYPAFFKGEKVDTLVNGDDDATNLGTYSGFAQISATLDPADGADAIVLFQRVFAPLDGSNPLQGPKAVKNLQCENQDFCNKFAQFEPARLSSGAHVLVIRAVDRAGGVRTLSYHFNVLNLRLALEQAYSTIRRLLLLPETPAQARTILAADLELIGFNPEVGLDLNAVHSAAYYAAQLWEQPVPFEERRFLELGNVVLYLVSLLKDLARVNDNWVDTSQLLDNLSMAAIAEAEMLYDWTAEEVGELDREVGAARGHLDQAFADQQSRAYQSAMLQLGHALFRLQNAYAPLRADGLEQVQELSLRLYRELDAYAAQFDLNGADLIGELTGPGGSYQQAQRRIERAGLNQGPESWLLLMLELVETSQRLKEAQREFVWVRFWQWELTQLVRFNVDAARLLACLDAYSGEENPPCPENSGIDLLHEAQCRYHEGIAYIDRREVDDALDVFIGSRCLMETIFDEIYNTPLGGFRPYPRISISVDCPPRARLFLYDFALLPGDADEDGVQDFRCTLR